MRPARGQIDRHAAAEGAAVKQNSASVDALICDEKGKGRVGRLITTLLGGPASAFAVAGIIEDQDVHLEQFTQLDDGSAAMAQVAGVAVAIKHRLVGARTRQPPCVDRRSILADKVHFLDVRDRGRLPTFACLHGPVNE